MESFANRLKEMRRERKLTQKQLANLIKSTDDSIYSWESGRSEPSIENLRSLCQVLEVTSDYLIGLTDF